MLEGPFRVGPWPGLSPRGGAVLLVCALLLGIASAVTGDPRRALPDLPLLGVTSMMPMLLATRIVRAPGAASAVCGAYLMPRTLVSLVDPTLAPPPLLLIPAAAFDLTLWLRRADLARLASLWPRRDRIWRKRPPKAVRSLEWWRSACAGGVFGLVLSAVEPAFAVLLGADSSVWAGSELVLAAALGVIGCALVSVATCVAFPRRPRRRPPAFRYS